MNIPRLMECNGFTPEFIKAYYDFYVDGILTVKAEAYRQSGTTEKTWATKSRDFKKSIDAHERLWPIEQLIKQFIPDATEEEQTKTVTDFMFKHMKLSNEELLSEAEKEFLTGTAPTNGGGERSEPETQQTNSSIHENEAEDTASNISSNPPAETNTSSDSTPAEANALDEIMASLAASNEISASSADAPEQTIDDLMQNPESDLTMDDLAESEPEFTPEEAIAMMTNSSTPKHMTSFGETQIEETLNEPVKSNLNSFMDKMMNNPDLPPESRMQTAEQQEIARLNKEIENITNKLHDTTRERNEFRAEASKLQHMIDAPKEPVNEDHIKINPQLSLEAFRIDNKNLKYRVKQLEADEKFNHTALIAHKDENVKLQRQNENLNETVLNLNAENANLKNELEKLNENNLFLTSNITDLKEQNHELISKLAEQPQEMTSGLEEQNQQLVFKISELEKQSLELGSEIVALEETINLLRQKEINQENKIQNLEETIKQMKRKETGYQTELLILKDEIKKLKAAQNEPVAMDKLLTQPEPVAMQIVTPEPVTIEDDLGKQIRKQKIAEARREINLKREEKKQDGIRRGQDSKKRKERTKYDTHELCKEIRTRESLANADEPKPVTRSAPTITPENEIKFTQKDNRPELAKKWKAFDGLELKAKQITAKREAESLAFA